MIDINVKKPASRNDVFHAIVRALETGEPIPREDLEKALLYFLPKPSTKRPKSAFEWVSAACLAPYKHVLVTDEVMIGTDGKHMHVAPRADALEPGLYMPGKAPVRVHDATVEYPVRGMLDLVAEPVNPEPLAEEPQRSYDGIKDVVVWVHGTPILEEYYEGAIAPGEAQWERPGDKVIRGKNRFGEFVIALRRY